MKKKQKQQEQQHRDITLWIIKYIFKRFITEKSARFLSMLNQEFRSRWISIKTKSIWPFRVINECYVYCFSLRRSINAWNNYCISNCVFHSAIIDWMS